MARTDTLPNFLTDVKSAIAEKTGITQPIVATEFDEKINEIDTKINIDGIIEEYQVASGGNVSAGDFVEYFNDKIEKKNNILKAEENEGRSVSAIALSQNKVFIIHSQSDSKYLYGLICSINEDKSISIGKDTSIIEKKSAGQTTPSIVKITENIVSIACKVNSMHIYAIVCEIKGTSISKGIATLLITDSSLNNKKLTSIKLNDNKIFTIYEGSNNLTGILYKIENKTITLETTIQLSDMAMISTAISSTIIKENTIFIAYGGGNSDSNFIYGIVCKIVNSNIVTGVNVLLSNETNSGKEHSVSKLSENKAFLTYGYLSDSYYSILSLVCKIENLELTIDISPRGFIATFSSSNIIFPFAISTVILSKNRVFIVYDNGESNCYRLYGIICKVDENSIEYGKKEAIDSTSVAGRYLSAILLQGEMIFIAHSGDGKFYLKASIVSISKEVITVTTQNEILGIAKTSGTSGQNINVYVPRV